MSFSSLIKDSTRKWARQRWVSMCAHAHPLPPPQPDPPSSQRIGNKAFRDWGTCSICGQIFRHIFTFFFFFLLSVLRSAYFPELFQRSVRLSVVLKLYEWTTRVEGSGNNGNQNRRSWAWWTHTTRRIHSLPAMAAHGNRECFIRKKEERRYGNYNRIWCLDYHGCEIIKWQSVKYTGVFSPKQIWSLTRCDNFEAYLNPLHPWI